jgi:hypothetical protein
MGKHVFESAGEATRVNKVNEHGAASHASDYALPRAATRQAETLHRATGGRLSRASHVFLQMQRQFGNRHA